jgi:tetratricopeptide (TPR) repeat protein
MALRLGMAVQLFPGVDVFREDDANRDEGAARLVNPLHWQTVRQRTFDDWNAYFVIKGLQILGSGQVRHCYLGLCMPERIVEGEMLLTPEGLVPDRAYPPDGDFIPAVAIEDFGIYEQFYSHQDPEVGIAVLRRGLTLARHKAPIAQDLAYILRDEGRHEEALAAFTIAIEEGASSHFILEERADLYKALGFHEEANRDRDAAEAWERRSSALAVSPRATAFEGYGE